MKNLTAKRFRLPLLIGIAALGMAVAGSSFAQQSRASSDKKKEDSAPTIDAATGKALNAAIEFLNMPELRWQFGYPLALIAMVLSAVLPTWYFKRRGWL